MAKHYAHFLTTTAYFKLDVACIPLWAAFGGMKGGVYLVGSVLRKPDWRDVDIRAILEDAEYDRIFPPSTVDRFGENAQWKITCIAISHYLSSVTGLPIDFQIQRQTQANERYPRAEDHRRNAIGLFVHEYDHLPCEHVWKSHRNPDSPDGPGDVVAYCDKCGIEKTE